MVFRIRGFDEGITYSQRVNGHSADILLLKNFLNVKREDGVFLELGACDGIYISNTKALEDMLNYSGVLIEHRLSHYNKLVENRPRCKNYNCKISTKDGDKDETVNVPCKKLSDILHHENIKYIDFWSLDVEGDELEVLKTMDWDIPVYIICIEVTVWGEKDKEIVEECRKILRDKGFESNGKKYGLDEWWINNNYFRKDLLFNAV